MREKPYDRSRAPSGGHRRGCSAPPWRWWRTRAAHDLTSAARLSIRAAISRSPLLRYARWFAAANGDPAAAVGLALQLGAAAFGRPEFDVAMTSLALCADGGDPAARLAMRHLFGRLHCAGSAETRVAESWLMQRGRRRSPRRRSAE
ncbi:hypothetical protein QY049_20620 [Bradyrhizobium sp. WYCCWR 13022]|uniref:hypothetical protein n=1 Tax=unclassified Bradyrhizobium TaxID=2631580 RepID=UPI00263B14C7|nr:hypothetical protein [Bradyrhizobium sp. WYCCWR 13022]MDN4985569.1 hypothetical protein [Bradyrhizobium sp. WYCCWR 13022]